MNLTQQQKLFLHGVLFHYGSSFDVGHDVRSGLEEIMDMLREDLTSSSDPHYEATTEEEDEESELDEDDPNYVSDMRIDVQDFVNLSDIKVIETSTGRKNNFRFQETTEGELEFELTDARDDSVECFGPVAWVKRGGKEFVVLTKDGESFLFELSKFPKDWTSLLRLSEKVGV
jgi:hypothetical protein